MRTSTMRPQCSAGAVPLAASSRAPPTPLLPGQQQQAWRAPAAAYCSAQHHQAHGLPLQCSRRGLCVAWAAQADPVAGSGASRAAAERLSKLVGAGITIDPAYASGGLFLKSIGFSNNAEVARILDIAMNPDSLFMDHRGKRSRNASARSLDVDLDMRPVVDFFLSKGMSKGDALKVISGHPPVLSYSVSARLEPFWAYLAGLGVQDINAAIAARPSLLGLDVDQNLSKIVDYLKSVETPPEQIIKLLLETI